MTFLLVGILTVLSTFAPITDARVRAPERPVVPNVTATSPTEIKMSWCRVKPNKIEIDHYELYIDNELEYSGIDVMYVAKRLKPWTWYEVKLRACGFQPGFSCSPFSRPILVKTLSSSENDTAIPSTASVFKIVVLPTYMFITGVLVGVVVLAMALIWRYLQSNNTWMNEPAFELPTHVQSEEKLCRKSKIAKLNAFLSSNKAGNASKATALEKTKLEGSNAYYQIAETEEGIHVSKTATSENVNGKQEISVQTVDSCLLVAIDEPSHDTENNESTNHEGTIQEGPLGDGCVVYSDKSSQQHTEDTMHFGEVADFQETQSKCISDRVHHSTPDSHPSIDEPHDPSNGMVIVVDNSNIYIGAQECASANNAGDKKRHVRVKLQNLVKILEKDRPKERTFVCGSSPPATEHVWDVYRHLGYVVDLEERRGKDEQRVDEGLHLFIYKAICELSPRVLVVASGDGMKGKSENSTSFPGCAVMALEKGWSVEVYSWKHSLSTEWLKLAKKYPDSLTINYLDKYVNHITFVDGKHGRKCLPVAGNQGRDRSGSYEARPGRLTYHNG